MDFSPLMLGTVQFGVDYGIANKAGKPSADAVREMLSYAWENGVNCLDTASAYGDSEIVVGNALEELQLAHQMKIVSKVAHIPDGLSSAALKEFIQKSVTDSLQRLKVDYLDVCLFHHEKYFYAMDILAELKEQGVIKAAGVSFSGLSFDDAGKVLSSPLLDAVQVPGSLLDRRFETGSPSGFALARERAIPVFVRSTYLQGLLLMENAPPRLAEMQPALDAIGNLSLQYNLSREALCVRYMLGVSGVTSLLMGVDNLNQLRENIALINEGPLPPEIHQHVTETLPLLPVDFLCPYLWPKE